MIRLLVLGAAAVAFVAFGFWWQADQTSRSRQDAARLEAELQAVAATVDADEVAAALGEAQLGDYRALDALVPLRDQVRVDLDPEGFRISYQADDHTPARCFVLVLNPAGNGVVDHGTC